MTVLICIFTWLFIIIIVVVKGFFFFIHHWTCSSWHGIWNIGNAMPCSVREQWLCWRILYTTETTGNKASTLKRENGAYTHNSQWQAACSAAAFRYHPVMRNYLWKSSLWCLQEHLIMQVCHSPWWNSVYACVYEYACVYMYAHMCMCVYVYACMYVCMHLCMHRRRQTKIPKED